MDKNKHKIKNYKNILSNFVMVYLTDKERLDCTHINKKTAVASLKNGVPNQLAIVKKMLSNVESSKTLFKSNVFNFFLTHFSSFVVFKFITAKYPNIDTDQCEALLDFYWYHFNSFKFSFLIYLEVGYDTPLFYIDFSVFKCLKELKITSSFNVDQMVSLSALNCSLISFIAEGGSKLVSFYGRYETGLWDFAIKNKIQIVSFRFPMDLIKPKTVFNHLKQLTLYYGNLELFECLKEVNFNALESLIFSSKNIYYLEISEIFQFKTPFLKELSIDGISFPSSIFKDLTTNLNLFPKLAEMKIKCNSSSDEIDEIAVREMLRCNKHLKKITIGFTRLNSKTRFKILTN